MCKIVTFTNSSKLDVEKTTEIIGNILLKTERDGFGYAVQGKSGVFGEKCVDSDFYSRFGLKKGNPSKAVIKKYSKFGKFSDPTGPMILHGRTSTNVSGLKNCHPMIEKDHYLIHNGVVDDHGPKFKAKTDTDSENVLHRFIEGIDSVAKNLEGYYAFTCISPDGKLHVVRDQIADLYMAWLPEYQTYIFATTKYLIDEIAIELEATIDGNAIDQVKPDTYMIFNGNKVESCKHFESLGYTYKQSRHASRSLGRSLYDSERDHDMGIVDASEEELFSSYLDADEFEKAIDFLDDTWEIMDQNDREITLEQFRQLDSIAQKQCWFLSPDGYDFTYGGNVA